MNTFKSLFLNKLFLLVFVAFGSFIVIGCDGGGGDSGGGGDEINGPGPITTIQMAEISFAPSLLGRFALDNLTFNPTLTFDELEFSPPEPINGKTVQGVTFFFTVGGMPSIDATVVLEQLGLPAGPGDTPLITPPIIEGDDTGLLTLIFDPPVGSVSFDFSLGDIVDIPDAATIRIFDEMGDFIATASADASVPPGFIFPEGTLGLGTNGIVNAIENIDSEYSTQNEFNYSDTGWEIKTLD